MRITIASTLLVTTALAGVPAFAQVVGLEEITVTARRSEESLQRVPVAVTALTGRDLDSLHAVNLSDITAAAPNLNLVQGRGSSSSANIYIRGIGQPDALQTFDPGVGVYLDDVYISRIQGTLFNLFDVQRIEVLRGPQGTLYGKNTIGGAIKIITRRPGDQIHANAQVSYGSYNTLDMGASAAGPLIEGKLAIGAAVQYRDRDGFVTDPITKQKYNDERTRAGRASLSLTPTDNVSALINFDITHQRPSLTLGRAEAALIQTDFVTGARVLQPAPTGEYNRNTDATTTIPRNLQAIDAAGVGGTLAVTAGDFTLKSITAYRRLRSHSYIDIDATRFRIGDVKEFLDQHQTSEELQASYEPGGPFKGVAGLFYMNENNRSTQASFADNLFAILGTPAPFFRGINDNLTTKSYAAYAQGVYDVTQQVSVTAGLRYSEDKKNYFRFTNTTLSGAPFGVPFQFTAIGKWTNWSPKVSLDVKAGENVLVYASVSRGFKSGGFNGRANAAGDNKPYDPETVWTYEAGVKSQTADGRLRANGAVFYNDYQNFQARVGGTNVGEFPVLNAATARTYGAELELTAVPIENLTLSAVGGYLNAKYRKFLDRGRDRSNDHMAFAPEWNGRLSAAYAFGLGSAGTLTAQADASFRSKTWLSVDNQNALTQKGYWVANASLTYVAPDSRWSVIGTVKNAFDQIYKTDAQEFSNVGNIQTAYYGDPRTFLLTVRYNY
jgi:iron complex outermembrane receptor protein